ncbi:MAG: hypothetical protein EOM50_09325 [Erysipelotrichia bacterium]|nr:hypothetical protein [Erysipelotrichia bacterium]
MPKKRIKAPIKTAFYDILTCKAKKEFTTASSYHMSVYEFWKERGYITPLQMGYLEKGFNGQAKNKSYYRVLGREK